MKEVLITGILSTELLGLCLSCTVSELVAMAAEGG